MTDSNAHVGQLSADGYYRWDGTHWQPVGQAARPSVESEPSGAAIGQISPDGYYRWDGSAWQPVTGALVQAFAQQGVTVDASVVSDVQMVNRVIAELDQWYAGLDSDSRAMVDALCSQGLTHLLADPEVGVVAEGAGLLHALAATRNSLGDALQAANRALQQSGGPAVA